jgi:hypothetical protein
VNTVQTTACPCCGAKLAIEITTEASAPVEVKLRPVGPPRNPKPPHVRGGP